MESTSLIQNAERKLEEAKEKSSENIQNQNADSGCESFTINSTKSSDKPQEEHQPGTPTNIETNADNPQVEFDIDDIIILRRDPVTNKSIINKSAYVKLHRSVSPNRNSTTLLKEKYEGSETKLEAETLESIKNKYSPSSFGYPRPNSIASQVPVPKPRNSAKSYIPTSVKLPKGKSRHSFPLNARNKDENSNNVLRKNSSSSGEFITIVTRSESEGSIDKLEKELNLFTMEGKTKEKKRNNSFRKMFTGKFFSKEKKKVDEQQSKLPCKENVAYSDNFKNESNAFSRQSPYRHTVGGNNVNKDPKLYRNDSQRSAQKPNLATKEIDQRYAQMHINEFQGIKRTFENQNPYQNKQYVNMNRPLPTANPGPIGYSKMSNIGKYIDTSSSSSTVNSERDKIYQNKLVTNKQYFLREADNKSEAFPYYGINKNTEGSRETPPRAQELRQDFRLVKPKAVTLAHLERQAANPHQQYAPEPPQINSKSNMIYSPKDNRSDFEEEYGRVFDSIERPILRNKPDLQRSNSFRNTVTSIDSPRIPRSPSLESTKLKLPMHREIVPLSPRMRSPIPQDRVSTEKLIATELLKPTRSPTPTRANTNTVGDNANYNQNNKNIETVGLILAKPPIARSSRRSTENVSTAQDNNSLRRMQNSPMNEHNRLVATPEVQDRTVTNAMIHAYPPNVRSLTPTNQIIRSPSPVRPQSARSVTPVEIRTPSSNKSQSPQKDDIRRNVEAYYWKEIKKLKEQEDQDIYYYQIQMRPYAFADDYMSTRRSRSISPSVQRNSRRSLSLPRDHRPSNANNDIFVDRYGRIQPKPIPEGNVVTNQQKIHYQNYNIQQNFLRNVPERQSVDGVPRTHYSTSSLYRPIFKRGSLTAPIREFDDQQNKKVSFTGNDTQRDQAWPTRNGFTQSPPQRRSDGSNSINISDDDVFLPPVNSQTSKLLINGREVYGYTNVPQQLSATHQLNHENYSPRQNTNGQNVYGYTSQRYPINNSQREPLYGPLVVANVRPNQGNPTESPYGPLVVTNNRVQKMNVPGNSQEDGLYRQPVDIVRRHPLSRHNSIQSPENIYGQRQLAARKMSYENSQLPMPNEQQIQNHNAGHHMQRREIIVTDEIFGQFGGYIPPDNNVQYVNIVRQNNVESPYVKTVLEPTYGHDVRHSALESPYGYGSAAPRQITVRNKVCDIYGQIHDRDSPSMTPAHQKSGVVLGQLQKSPQTVRQSYSQLPNENFIRNSRLTASANDMYRRNHNGDPRYRSDVIYQRNQRPVPEEGAPTRPLPPVPSKTSTIVDKHKIDSNSSTNTKGKPKKEKKKRSFFGKAK